MELMNVNPAELLVDRNIREAGLDEVFLASVRDLGVLVPVVAVRTGDDGLRVRYGHRRTLAAVAVGRESIPVVVAGDDVDEDAAAEVQRVIGQWAENEHRAGLTTAEQVGAVEQLAALGLPAEEISRRTHTAPERVAAALRVAQAPRARAAVAEDDGVVDLLQAAVLAEFDDDQAIVENLIQAARHGRLDHEAQRARDERAMAAETARLEAELHAAGVPVADADARDDTATRLSWLRDAEGASITEDAHAQCPGHTAWVEEIPAWQWRQVQDEDAPLTGRCRVVHACADPAAHGHRDLRSPGGSRPATLAELSEEDRETERARRRDVIESNKAWESAEAVRRRWLAEHVPARKTAPKGTAAFLARLLADDPQVLTSVGGNHYAATLLGKDSPQYGRSRGIADQAEKASDARALVLVLTQALACCETATSRDDWRTRRATTVAYLQFLASMGYTLSAVETRATTA